MSHIFLNEKSSFGSTGSGKSERNSFHFAFVPFFAFLIVSPLACAHTAKSSRVLTPSYPLRSMVAAFHSAFFQASEQIFSLFHWGKAALFHFSLGTRSILQLELASLCTRTLAPRHFRSGKARENRVNFTFSPYHFASRLSLFLPFFSYITSFSLENGIQSTSRAIFPLSHSRR